MATLRVTRDEYSPKLWRLLWRLGIPLAPPIQRSFFANFMLCSAIFPLGFAVLFAVRETGMAQAAVPYPGIAAMALAGAGLLFGLGMATYWRARRVKFGLPLWHEPEGSSRER